MATQDAFLDNTTINEAGDAKKVVGAGAHSAGGHSAGAGGHSGAPAHRSHSPAHRSHSPPLPSSSLSSSARFARDLSRLLHWFSLSAASNDDVVTTSCGDSSEAQLVMMMMNIRYDGLVRVFQYSQDISADAMLTTLAGLHKHAHGHTLKLEGIAQAPDEDAYLAALLAACIRHEKCKTLPEFPAMIEGALHATPVITDDDDDEEERDDIWDAAVRASVQAALEGASWKTTAMTTTTTTTTLPAPIHLLVHALRRESDATKLTPLTKTQNAGEVVCRAATAQHRVQRTLVPLLEQLLRDARSENDHVSSVLVTALQPIVSTATTLPLVDLAKRAPRTFLAARGSLLNQDSAWREALRAAAEDHVPRDPSNPSHVSANTTSPPLALVAWHAANNPDDDDMVLRVCSYALNAYLGEPVSGIAAYTLGWNLIRWAEVYRESSRVTAIAKQVEHLVVKNDTIATAYLCAASRMVMSSSSTSPRVVQMPQTNSAAQTTTTTTTTTTMMPAAQCAEALFLCEAAAASGTADAEAQKKAASVIEEHGKHREFRMELAARLTPLEHVESLVSSFVAAVQLCIVVRDNCAHDTFTSANLDPLPPHCAAALLCMSLFAEGECDDDTARRLAEALMPALTSLWMPDVAQLGKVCEPHLRLIRRVASPSFAVHLCLLSRGACGAFAAAFAPFSGSVEGAAEIVAAAEALDQSGTAACASPAITTFVSLPTVAAAVAHDATSAHAPRRTDAIGFVKALCQAPDRGGDDALVAIVDALCSHAGRASDEAIRIVATACSQLPVNASLRLAQRWLASLAKMGSPLMLSFGLHSVGAWLRGSACYDDDSNYDATLALARTLGNVAAQGSTGPCDASVRRLVRARAVEALGALSCAAAKAEARRLSKLLGRDARRGVADAAFVCGCLRAVSLL